MGKSDSVENQKLDQQSNQKDIWTQAKLEAYIRDKIGESHHLDYKAAGALAKDDKKYGQLQRQYQPWRMLMGELLYTA